MKNKLYIAFLLLFSCFFVSCVEDEVEPFEGPYRLSVGGPASVRPESTVQYTIGDVVNPEGYTWSVVEGPAEITGAATGSTVSVLFKSLGEVKLLVTNGRDSRTLTIAVTPPRSGGKDVFTMTSTLNNAGVLRSGQSDTLFLNFNQSLANNPTVSIINSDTTFQSGTLGAVQKLSGMRYYTIYTAGEGNGTPRFYVSGIEAIKS